jgi:C1A family cysteine protease
MKASTLIVLAAVIFVASAINSNEHELREQFEAFMSKYNKQYATTELPTRYANFKASLQRAHQKNLESTRADSAKFGITKFSDMTPEEFRTTVLMKNPIGSIAPRMDVTPRKDIAEGLPATIDWRTKGAVTAVKDQEQCGSCWAFSTTEAVESAWILAGKGTNKNTILAPQQIVDCDDSDDGCDGGNPPTAYEYLMQAGGQEAEKDYPYKGVDENCNFNAADVIAKISDWSYATSDYSESTLQQNLVSWGPVSICVDASAWQDYQSGVMTWYQCAWINQLDHCVQLVGFNTTASTPYYIVRNSWNTDWGVEGYIWLEMGEDTCGLTYEATWPKI